MEEIQKCENMLKKQQGIYEYLSSYIISQIRMSVLFTGLWVEAAFKNRC